MPRVCVLSIGMPYEGGAELRAYRHTRYLRAERGIECMLIVRHQSEKRSQNNALPSFVHPVRLCFQHSGETRLPGRFIKLMLHLGELGVRLGWLLFTLRHQFDILHVIFAASWFGLASIPLAKALSKPVIVEMVALHTDDPLTLNRRHNRPEQQILPHRPLKYDLFLKADAFVSKSHALSQSYREAGLPESKLFQIHSGVDSREFSPPTIEEKVALRGKLGLNSEDVIILFVGRIDERKGPHRLLAAFREIVPRHPQAKLLIVGPAIRRAPSLPEALYDRAAAWGLSKYVQIVGQVSNVHEYMRAADIFALPTIQEGFSVAILEAMSSGLAIVTSDIPEIALSQVQHAVEGLLVPTSDTTRLAQALMKLISDSALRARLGEAARRRVLKEFTLDIIGDQYVRLYERLLERESRRV